MDGIVDVDEFCRLAMADYERQWTEARGHQERHPLKEKMRALSDLTARSRDAREFREALVAGCCGDDAIGAMLCQDLLSRWDSFQHAGSAGGSGRV